MNHKQKFARGVSLIWAMGMMTGLIALASLAVDYGMVQLTRAQLQHTAEAAARAGAMGLAVSGVQARLDAESYIAANLVPGSPLPAGAREVRVGVWEADQRAFRAAQAGERANAVQVSLGRTAATGNALPTPFAQILGRNGVDVRAEAVAIYQRPVELVHRVDGFANPFLAGMPAGSVASRNNPHNSPDYAGDPASPDFMLRRQSPPVVRLEVRGGDVLEFDSIAGTVRHDPNLAYFEPDGNLGSIGSNTNGNENGIADTTAPINSLVGVFLNHERPDVTSAPAGNLRFGTAAARDFVRIEPRQKQVFFIGDGANSLGQKQRFVVPAGATRLYLATWDFFEWNNNWGHRDVRISRPGKVTTVQLR